MGRVGNGERRVIPNRAVWLYLQKMSGLSPFVLAHLYSATKFAHVMVQVVFLLVEAIDVFLFPFPTDEIIERTSSIHYNLLKIL